jgi:hypothetical protein
VPLQEKQYTKAADEKRMDNRTCASLPIPDLVDRARTALENNKGYEHKHLAQNWELRGACTLPMRLED